MADLSKLQSPEFFALPDNEQRLVIQRIDPSLTPEDVDEVRFKLRRFSLPQKTLPTQFEVGKREMAAPTPREGPQQLRGLFMPGERDWRAAGIAGTAGLGMTLGAPAGLPGMAVGGALGAGFGALGSELAGIDPSASTGEAYQRALEEAFLEVVFQGGAAAVTPAKVMARRKIAAVNDQMIELGRRYGVRLGLEDVTARRAFTYFRDTLGRFPVLSGPFRESSERRAGDIVAAQDRLFDEVAPLETTAALGRQYKRLGNRRFRQFRQAANQKYQAFKDLAREEQVQVPANLTRVRAAEILEENTENVARIAIQTKEGERQIPLTLKSPMAVRHAQKLIKLVDFENINQWRNAVQQVEGVMERLQKQGLHTDYHIMATLKDSLDMDLRAIESSSPAAAALREADDFFHNTLKTVFETPTGQQFGKVDKRAFKVGYSLQGTKNPDELFDLAFRTKSVDAMRDLRKIVPEKTFNRSVRIYLKRGFDAALEYPDDGRVLFNMKAAQKYFGVGVEKSTQREVLAEALKTTNVDIDDFENFFKLAATVAKTNKVDVSKFIARRATLGGAKSALRSVTPGAPSKAETTVDVLKGAAGALGFIFGGRKLGWWLTEPRTLKLMTEAIDPATSDVMRRTALMRLSRLTPKVEDEKFQQYKQKTGEQVSGYIPMKDRLPGEAVSAGRKLWHGVDEPLTALAAGSMMRPGAARIPVGPPVGLPSMRTPHMNARGPAALMALGELLESAGVSTGRGLGRAVQRNPMAAFGYPRGSERE